ncbi:MAG: pyrroline-5-carboxylate reductase [Actinomycetota bacterium]|nr:pyrroline-5-carboxylate reductase [Actinomycetota bacterium]MDA3024421.1 pyrroline-5-carboxylate reductase [Actinomycetota bacterium]
MNSPSATVLAVIGGGNMGAALAGGLLSSGIVSESSLVIVETLTDRRRVLNEMYPHLPIVATIPPCTEAVVAVKPPDVVTAARDAVTAGARRVLSIAAGITIAGLEEACGPDVAVVRAMPNTPSLVGQGASAIAGGRWATENDMVWAESILGSVGLVVRVVESDLDAVTGLIGSGPAYLFLVAESLMEAGRAQGLDDDVVDSMVRQLFTGAAALMAEGDDPSDLRVRVTSPGGTTAAGLGVLDEAGVRRAFVNAVEAATARSRELGR